MAMMIDKHLQSEEKKEEMSSTRETFTFPDELKKETTFEYDKEQYNFEGIIRDMLLGDIDTDVGLSELHSLQDAKGAHVLTFASDQNLPFHKKYYNSPEIPELLGVYRKFVAAVLAPKHKDEILVVQTKPTFRVHLPNNTAIPSDTGGDPEHPGLHKDSDYNHPVNEVNYWLPVTNVAESNAVWIESSPEQGDFHPLTAEVGQCLRFWGPMCRHYNKFNEQGQTRVSFDFRVINYSDWKTIPKEWFETARTAQAKMKMEIGGYYMIYKNGEFFDEDKFNMPRKP